LSPFLSHFWDTFLSLRNFRAILEYWSIFLANSLAEHNNAQFSSVE
jgi:hypothetical protein